MMTCGMRRIRYGHDVSRNHPSRPRGRPTPTRDSAAVVVRPYHTDSITVRRTRSARSGGGVGRQSPTRGPRLSNCRAACSVISVKSLSWTSTRTAPSASVRDPLSSESPTVTKLAVPPYHSHSRILDSTALLYGTTTTKLPTVDPSSRREPWLSGPALSSNPRPSHDGAPIFSLRLCGGIDSLASDACLR